jgi:hypothetical protein
MITPNSIVFVKFLSIAYLLRLILPIIADARDALISFFETNMTISVDPFVCVPVITCVTPLADRLYADSFCPKRETLVNELPDPLKESSFEYISAIIIPSF